jgi:dienelactone hydrolase
MTPTGPTAIATTVLDHFRAGRYSEIREMFAPGLRPLVTVESLRAAWGAELEKHGPVRAVGTPVADPPASGGVLVRVPVTFERGRASLLVTVTGTGWVTGVQPAGSDAARPLEPWQPPSYADPAAFEEHEVTVGTGRFAVGGTLTRPRAAGRHPAVVFLTGSGPNDRDETIGRNKPFKDLAWGLAGHGIAVLRFDKVTHTHRAELAAAENFTLDDEYVHHAVAALSLLRSQAAVDPARLFVLGHSFGGSVAPRVAAADPSVAGLVILAGGAQPVQWAAVRQFRYLASLDPSTAAAAQPLIDTVTRQAEAVDSPDLSPATPREELPFGAPASYWLDVRAYDPPAAAARLAQPMLILQGARDYQATVADDLSRWEAALSGRDDVTVRVLAADNHLFFPGTGPSSPAEYEPAQHVDPAVITEITGWLHEHLSR